MRRRHTHNGRPGSASVCFNIVRSCRRAALNLARVRGEPTREAFGSVSVQARNPHRKATSGKVVCTTPGEADIQPKLTKKIYYRVIVSDSGTLEAGDVVIRLNGIVASEADAQCHDKQGKNWPCGAAAKTALRRLVRARAVVCDLPEPGEQKSFTARCAVSGTDLSTWMVRQGWAKPNDPPEPALADAAEAAKSERIGLWQEPIMVR